MPKFVAVLVLLSLVNSNFGNAGYVYDIPNGSLDPNNINCHPDEHSPPSFTCSVFPPGPGSDCPEQTCYSNDGYYYDAGSMRRYYTHITWELPYEVGKCTQAVNSAFSCKGNCPKPCALAKYYHEGIAPTRPTCHEDNLRARMQVTTEQCLETTSFLVD